MFKKWLKIGQLVKKLASHWIVFTLVSHWIVFTLTSVLLTFFLASILWNSEPEESTLEPGFSVGVTYGVLASMELEIETGNRDASFAEIKARAKEMRKEDHNPE